MTFRRLTLVVAAIAFFAVSIDASVPTFINYQGFLTDTDGAALDTTANVTFRIFDTDVGGTPLWSESHMVTSVNGLFSVFLGALAPIDETIIDGDIRFLEVQLGAVPFSPRTPLAASPYAIRIATVDGASGGTMTGNLTLSAGNLNLDLSSASAGNIYKGGSLFIHNSGSSNTFIGEDAGNLTMTGSSNTAGGMRALYNNTTGSFNTAVGRFTLFSNSIGASNTASGFSALRDNTEGERNSAMGHAALLLNTIGSENTASGAYSLYSNIEGVANTANGHEALFSNTDGYNNTATGYRALYSNVNGAENTAVGSYALYSDSGYSNTAVGDGALAVNTTGNSNTAVGCRALISNFSGIRNTAIGYDADVTAENLTNATAIGYNSRVNASNKIRLGNAAVTVIEGQVAYTFTSDKNKKENFQPVDGEDVLKKIRGFELTSWNYKGHDPEKFRHYGPMAQDFFAAFGDDGVGEIGSETTLNTGDVTGILMIAVQTLSEQNEQAKLENQDLRKEIKDLHEKLQKFLDREEIPDRNYSSTR
jgi:hypothetical protein